MARGVVVDKDLCAGCGSCSELSPKVFEMSEDGEKSRVVLPES